MPQPQDGKKTHLAHLTGFRAIAAYLVLICHSFSVSFSYSASDRVHAFDCLAYLGMSLFFVLSGFVITYGYWDRFIALGWQQATRQFAVARFARLYPLYLLCLLGDPQWLSSLIAHCNRAEVISFLTLTQSWWNKQALTFSPSWSISTEWFFYICFMLWMLWPRAKHAPADGIRRNAFIVLGIILLWLSALFFLRDDITVCLSWVLGDEVWTWLRYYAPYVRIAEFIAGAFAARMYMLTRTEAHSATHARTSLLLCIINITAIVFFMLGNTFLFDRQGFLYFLTLNFAYAPFLAYLCYACSRYPNLLTRGCGTMLFITGGEISYSLYLLQFSVFKHVLPSQVATSSFMYELSFAKAIFYILLTTIIAYCSYRIIEVPCRHWLRKWLNT